MLKRKTLMVATAAVLALNSSQAFAQSDVNSALQNICTIVKTNLSCIHLIVGGAVIVVGFHRTMPEFGSIVQKG